MNEELKIEIRKIALQNAFEHDGQTRDKIVLGKILGLKSELRNQIKDISPIITQIVENVNNLGLELQKKEIEETFPDILAPKEKIEERQGLPELKTAIFGKVVTRFPPEPNGYPHIGHAKAAIINSEYAKMYGGKFILRMDDTNPEAERMEYHAAIKVGLEWLGIKFDLIKSTSDDMNIFYEKAIELIESNRAYICMCKREDISKNRKERIACKCSKKDISENQKNWKKMHDKFKPGEAIVRFRGNMKDDNAVMRDPVLLRIIEEKHYTQGDKYRIWPSYDFAVAIEDSLDGVTHAFRSKEFELRKELIEELLDALNLRKPEQGFFSRLEFKGMPISKRIIKPLIEEGKVSWYDDPRLPTLEALRRRGIKPEAIRKFVMSLGLTKANTLAPFDSLEAFNRKIIDSESIRLFMVPNPKKLVIKNLTKKIVQVSNHPIKDMGSRNITIDDKFYVSNDDVKEFLTGMKFRLLGLGNISVIENNSEMLAEFIGEDEQLDIPKIQWVPFTTSHKIKMIIPDVLFNENEEFNKDSLKEIEVYTEPHYLELKDGDMIQFVRFGYCRKDSQNQAIFTHK